MRPKHRFIAIFALLTHDEERGRHVVLLEAGAALEVLHQTVPGRHNLVDLEFNGAIDFAAKDSNGVLGPRTYLQSEPEDVADEEDDDDAEQDCGGLLPAALEVPPVGRVERRVGGGDGGVHHHHRRRVRGYGAAPLVGHQEARLPGEREIYVHHPFFGPLVVTWKIDIGAP